jgi:hypothetical protein
MARYAGRHVRPNDQPPPPPDGHPTRRTILRVGAATGAGAVLGASLVGRAVADPTDGSGGGPAGAAPSGGTVVQTTQVVVIDNVADLPPGTPAGTLVVVTS